MPRPALLLMCLLSFVTAIALLAGAALTAPPRFAPGEAAVAAASRAAVYRFYDAVNATIASGDLTPLALVIAPDYVQLTADGSVTAGRPALERAVRALHAVAPGLKLEAETLVADGDRVVAMVGTRGSDRADFLGLALQGLLAWEPVDIFRVVDGRVTERTTVVEHSALLEEQHRGLFGLAPPSERVVTAQRVTLLPGEWRRAPGADGPRVLAVEAGEVAVAVGEESAGSAPVPEADAPTLGAGTWLNLAAPAAYAVLNVGAAPAVVLDVLVDVPFDGDPAFTESTEGALGQFLAGGHNVPVSLPTGPVVLAFGQATLAPGARLTWERPAGPVLLTVEEGTLSLTTTGEEPSWLRSAANGQTRSRGPAILDAGDGALVASQTGTEVRNAGEESLRLLVVTLLTADAVPPPRASSSVAPPRPPTQPTPIARAPASAAWSPEPVAWTD